MTFPSFSLEQNHWKSNRYIIGLDEAGRGCLAGPVFGAAVVFPIFFDLNYQISIFLDELKNSLNLPDDKKQSQKKQKLIEKYSKNPNLLINDSKLLDPISREIAYDFIINHSAQYSIKQVSAEIIDEINILQASQLAFRLALEEFKNIDAHLLIDGNYFRKYGNFTYETVVKGDSKSVSIAAASILAKVSRDNFLKSELHIKYPHFGFDKHFGYATKLHYEAISKFGETEFHRKTFLKKYNSSKNSPQLQALF